MDMAGTSSNVAGASMSMALRTRSFHGPLPSPEIIREYEEIRPDIVDTVLTMALSEQKHRHWREAELIALEREKEKTEQSLIGRGQWLGFAICLGIILLSAYVASEGHPGFGSLLGGGAVVTLVANFIGTNVIRAIRGAKNAAASDPPSSEAQENEESLSPSKSEKA